MDIGEVFGDKGNVIEGNFGKSFKEEIDSMKKSGDLVDKDNMVISEKITDREMFKNSNLNKEPISEKFIDYTIQDINKKEPLEGMKIANKIIKREDEFKDLTKFPSITLPLSPNTSPISMFHGSRIRELAACGLELDACYSGLDACRLALEQVGSKA